MKTVTRLSRYCQKGKFLSTLIVLVATTGVVSSSIARDIPLMTSEQKQQTVRDFNELLSDGEYASQVTRSGMTEAQRRAAPEPPTVVDEHGNPVDFSDNLFYKNGKYKVKLMFRLDSDFPKLYGGSEHFYENDSETFKEQWSQIIFEHYLGQNYSNYEPELYSVAKVCSIYALVSTSEELTALLADNRIIKAVHAGTPSSPIVETR